MGKYYNLTPFTFSCSADICLCPFAPAAVSAVGTLHPIYSIMGDLR